MFGIRVFAPPSLFTMEAPQATGQLIVGDARLIFHLDLQHWRISDYERQWRMGITRLLHGAPSSALLTAYRRGENAVQLMWAMWAEAGRLHVQPHCVLAEELTRAFDPCAPYAHIDARIPVIEERLPMPEWSIDLDRFLAAALRLNWPFDA